MNALTPIDMTEVTRLTRAGRLMEATVLIQRGLAGGATVRGRAEEGMARAGHAVSFPSPSWGGARGGGSLRLLDGAEAIRGRDFGEPPSLTLPHKGEGNALASPERHVREYRAPRPDGSRFEDHLIQNRFGRRAYKLYIPGGASTEPMPLVVMLHGCTQSPDDFAAGTRMNEIAEEQGLFVAYPEQPTGANPSKCWNWFKCGDQQRDRGEPSLIADMTRHILRTHPVDPDRVFVAGLSAGGAAAAIMAHQYPDLFCGLCVHSGLACGAAKDLPSAFAAMRGGSVQGTPSSSPMPTIVFHGTGDRTVHPANADSLIAQFASGEAIDRAVTSGRAAGGAAFTRTIGTNAAGEAALEQWLLHGAGHAWSGGSPRGSYTDPRGPDASREMMRFFLAAKRTRQAYE